MLNPRFTAEQEQQSVPEAIVASLPEIACVFDDAGRVTQWNSSFESTLGYTAQDLLGIRALDIITEQQREEFQKAIEAALAGEASRVESVLVAKDGTQIPCLLTGVRIIRNHKPCVLGIALDLRKLRNLEESHHRLAAIVQQSDNAIISTDLNGTVTSWNHEAEQIYGYAATEALGQHISFCIPAEEQPHIAAVLQQIAEGGKLKRQETKRRRRDGTLIDVSLSISPIRDSTGRVIGTSEIARDITADKRTEIQSNLQSAALEAAASAIVITDRRGDILWVNHAFTAMTGYAKEEVLGKNPRILKSGEQSEDFYTDLWSTIASGNVWQGEIVNRRKDGTTYPEEMTITPVVRGAQNPNGTHFIAIKQDITRRKQAEETLLFKTALLEAQAETTIDGILVVDDSDRIVLTNKQFAIQFEIPDELLSTQDDHKLLKHVTDKLEAPDAFIEKVKYLYSHRDEKSTDELKFRDGRVFDRYSAPLVDSRNQYRGRIWYFRDITARKSAEERIQFLAYYDALTELPNRTLLQDRLNKALAVARRQKHKIALLFLDLDKFKAINDSLGHLVGDLLLKAVAERLNKCVREQDSVARLAGDEFLVMLTHLEDMSDAAVAAERFMDAITPEFVIQGQSVNVGCSIGISIFPEQGTDGESLIKNADAAMYSAKESGRNNIRFFTEDMNAQAVERLTLENSLRLALAKEELFLMYQPQIELATGRITGLEALLRWQHPELGLVPPDRFIRIAESSSLIVPIGEWVLRTACSQAKRWQEDGLPRVRIAVNVSPIQFHHQGFSRQVKRVLQETGLDPRYLELEVTETLLLANAEVTVSIIQELKAMRLTLAIDDFGTGYSSFSYLRQFQADRLKIDRSFVRDAASNPADAAIIKAIIGMAKSLKLATIAEGVEDEAQMSFLRANQCDEIQGFYFSRPLPVEKVAEQLRSSSIILPL